MNKDHACETMLSFRSINSFISQSLWIDIFFLSPFMSDPVKPTFKPLRSLLDYKFSHGLTAPSPLPLAASYSILHNSNPVQRSKSLLISFDQNKLSTVSCTDRCWLTNCHKCVPVFFKISHLKIPTITFVVKLSFQFAITNTEYTEYNLDVVNWALIRCNRHTLQSKAIQRDTISSPQDKWKQEIYSLFIHLITSTRSNSRTQFDSDTNLVFQFFFLQIFNLIIYRSNFSRKFTQDYKNVSSFSILFFHYSTLPVTRIASL